MMDNHRKTTAQFIEEAQNIHGDKYDYSEAQYVNTHTPVRIKCNRCGVVFHQSPANHLVGKGCPHCNKRQTHKRVNRELFIARAKEVSWQKIDERTGMAVEDEEDITDGGTTPGGDDSSGGGSNNNGGENEDGE